MQSCIQLEWEDRIFRDMLQETTGSRPFVAPRPIRARSGDKTSMPDMAATRAELREETAEAVCEIAICIAQAIHELDPEAHRRMNFAAGKAYNRLLGEERELAADILYRFGRALMDTDLFPESEDAEAG